MMFLGITKLLYAARRPTSAAGLRGNAKKAASFSVTSTRRSCNRDTDGVDKRAGCGIKVAAVTEAKDCGGGATGVSDWNEKKLAQSSSERSVLTKGRAAISTASTFVPDYREKVLQIFQRLADINNALQERYKAQSYQIAVDKLKKDDAIFLNFPPNIILPGVDDAKREELVKAVNATTAVGDKLKAKIVEILSTGDLAELHSLQAKPIIRAIQELTQVHGVGPRTAVAFYKNHGIKTVAELQQRLNEQESGVVVRSSCKNNTNASIDGSTGTLKTSKKSSPRNESFILRLTEAQRLGLKYHHDIMQRIPYEEVRLHEAFLKLRLRKYLGKGYELSICGSYRRRLPTSGDIDVLITRKQHCKGAVAPHRKKDKGTGGRNDCGAACGDSGGGCVAAGEQRVLAPQEVLAAFVEALKQERYIEATLAQGATKFMGVSRLKSYNYNAGATSPKMYPARRLDIRFVEPECFPAALLYFTGSKNFNVVMRAEAIKRNYVLNEYGLFRNELPADSAMESALMNFNGKNHGINNACIVTSGDTNKNINNSNSGGYKSGARGRWNAEAFQKLVRAQYYSSKFPAFMGSENEDGDDSDINGDYCADHAGNSLRKKTNKEHLRESISRQQQKQQQQQELAALWRDVEARRVKVRHERDIFLELGMAYVHPEQREV